MKLLTHQTFDTDRAGRWVYNNLLSTVGLMESESSDQNLLEGGMEKGNVLVPPDTPENIGIQMAEAQSLGTDAAVQASLYGSDKAKRYTPKNFRGVFGTEIQFWNPKFWGSTVVNPKQVPITQVKEALDGVGNPADLLSGSPLLSDQALNSVLGESVDQSIKMIEHSGGGDTKKISLTSLQYLEGLFEARHQKVSALLTEQSSDFLTKMDNEVWWKKKLRDKSGQRWRAETVLKYMKHDNDKSLTEIKGIIRGLEQKKEQDILKVSTTLMKSLVQGENSGDTVYLKERQDTIKAILNNPQGFLGASNSFQLGIPLDELFGKGFSPLDVLDALKRSDYLAPTIGANHWQMSHHNAIKTINGIDTRIKAVKNFEGTNLTKLESHVLKYYETDRFEEGTGMSLQRPSALVNNLKKALESARFGLNKNLNAIINGDLYMSDLEQFWVLSEYFSNNLDVLDQLPPELQKEYGSFLLAKREFLETPLVSGDRAEGGTVLWRVRSMNLAKNALDAIDTVIEKKNFYELGEHLLSTDKRQAQHVLAQLRTMVDSYDFFLAKLGVKPGTNLGDENVTKSLLSEFPEFEQGILKSVFEVSEFVETIRESSKKLDAERDEYEKLLLVDDDDVQATRDRLAKMEDDFDVLMKSGKSGLEDVRGMDIPGMEGKSGGGGFMGGDLETIQTTMQRNIEQLRTQLRGVEGSTDGGLIGKQKRRDNFTFTTPGRIGDSISAVTDTTKKLIDKRLSELGVNEDDLIEGRPEFDLLARLDLGDRVTKEMEMTANGLLRNESVQQFKKMKENKYFSLTKLLYAKANFQNTLTPSNLTNPKVMEDALYIREDSEGAVWYHTETQVIKIIAPRSGSDADQRNMAIWNKKPHEKGYKFFNISATQPDELGIFITANPENSAAKDNELYGKTQQNIALAESSLVRSGAADSYHEQQAA